MVYAVYTTAWLYIPLLGCIYHRLAVYLFQYESACSRKHVDRVWSTVGPPRPLSKFAMEEWMVLHQALLDCLADCSYPITFELLTSLPPVVCAAFEKLDNVRVVDTCLPLDR